MWGVAFTACVVFLFFSFPQDTNSKLATYQYLSAVPFDYNVRAVAVAETLCVTRISLDLHVGPSCLSEC